MKEDAEKPFLPKYIESGGETYKLSIDDGDLVWDRFIAGSKTWERLGPVGEIELNGREVEDPTNTKFVFTSLLKEAIDFAAFAHKDQVRKVGKEPYIVHPMGVAIILAKINCIDRIIAAGLLHDVIEDTDFTREDIEAKFGPVIAHMVNDVTEQDKSLPWLQRKELAIKHIAEMPLESVLVKTADKINNLTALLAAYEKEGKSVFENFNASIEEQVAMDEKLFHALKVRWKDNLLLDDLARLIDKLASISSNHYN